MRGVVHCFTGNWRQAQQYLEIGLYLGFNGIIFKLDLDEVIAKTPMERILVETDCPFLTPPARNASPARQPDGSHGGGRSDAGGPLARRSPDIRQLAERDEALRQDQGKSGLVDDRNEPMNVKYVIQRIAAIKNATFDQVAEITTQNAKTLFRL